MNTPRPVLIMNSVMAGLGLILGGAAIANYLDVELVGLLLLIHSGVAVALSTYVQGLVTPNQNVGANLAEIDGVPVMVAGPATKAIADGRPVDVTLADDPGWLPPEQGISGMPG
jgi:hypothetical protein